MDPWGNLQLGPPGSTAPTTTVAQSADASVEKRGRDSTRQLWQMPALILRHLEDLPIVHHGRTIALLTILQKAASSCRVVSPASLISHGVDYVAEASVADKVQG